MYRVSYVPHIKQTSISTRNKNAYKVSNVFIRILYIFFFSRKIRWRRRRRINKGKISALWSVAVSLLFFFSYSVGKLCVLFFLTLRLYLFRQLNQLSKRNSNDEIIPILLKMNGRECVSAIERKRPKIIITNDMKCAFTLNKVQKTAMVCSVQ